MSAILSAFEKMPYNALAARDFMNLLAYDGKSAFEATLENVTWENCVEGTIQNN